MMWSYSAQEAGRETQRRENRLGWQAWTSEQHIQQAKAQYAGGRANLLQHQPFENRQAAAKKAVATMGPEGLSARAKKGRETLRLRKLAEQEAQRAPTQVIFFKNQRYELPFIEFILVNSAGQQLRQRC